MSAAQKYNGLWFSEGASGYDLIFEKYDAQRDVIGAVHHKPPNSYRAVVYEKINSPQWRLPFWSERRPDAIFSDKDQAIAYIETALQSAKA